MSSIWSHTSEGSWREVTLAPGEVHDADGILPGLRLVSFARPEAASGGMLLVAGPDVNVLVNGQQVLGAVVLGHQDEIVLDGRRHYFSAETQPQLAIFGLAEGEHRPKCPACRGAIEDGDSVVRCPGCGRVYHQQTNAEGNQGVKACWTYAEHCRFCNHATALDGRGLWRPDHDETQDAAQADSVTEGADHV